MAATPPTLPPGKAVPTPSARLTPPRGAMVDVEGGRRLRVIVEGEPAPDLPLVVYEAGAFGTAADFAIVQTILASRIRTLAYDRAGLGYSDPGPEPRDSLAIAEDLKGLLDALGETGPLVLVGHSMAAVHVQAFALTWPDRVKGVVLIDAIPAEALVRPAVARFVKSSVRLADAARVGSRWMLTALAAPLMGDAVGLSGPAHAEKLHAFASPGHNHWSAAELGLWLEDGAQARKLGEFDRELPLAVVTAGRARPWWKRMQAEPARRSRSGYAENIPDAGHASLLGPKHCDAVVRAIDYVVKAALASR